MKTSTKILTGLLAFIFAVPLILAATLKNKVDKGAFTERISRDQDMPTYERTGTFGAFSTVKVVGPNPELLRCHLNISTDMSYKYYMGDGKDSIRVFAANDTLYIQYEYPQPKTKTEERDLQSLSINVNLPAFTNLVADGAIVIFDSLPSTNAISVTLKNNGVVKDGTKKKDDPISSVSPEGVSEISKAAAASTTITAHTVKGKTAPKENENPKLGMTEMDMGMKALPTFKFL